VSQSFSTQPVSPDGESSAVVVRQSQALRTQLPAQDAILFNEIGQRLPLAAIEPTGDGQEQQPKNRQVDHERQLLSRTARQWPQSGRS
jgi:hypothetical protein